MNKGLNVVTLVGLVSCMLSAGCGGSGVDVAAGPAILKIPVHWESRSRALNAPASADVLEILLEKAGPNGENLTFGTQRTGEGEHTTIAETAVQIKPGTYRVGFAFKTGFSTVATAGAMLKFTGDGEVIQENGSPLSGITTFRHIRSVTVSFPTLVDVNEKHIPSFVAHDDFGNLIAVPPGAYVITTTGVPVSVKHGSDTFGEFEEFTANQVGQYTVTVSIDGLASEPRTVNVVNIVHVPIKADLLAASPDGHYVYASIARGSKVVKIDAQTGTIVGSVSTGWMPSELVVSADGTRLYCPLLSAAKVVEIDANAMTFIRTVSIPHTLPPYVSPMAAGLVLHPTLPKSYVVVPTTYYSGFQGRPCLVQDGVVTHSAPVNNSASVGFLTGEYICTEGWRHFRFTVDANGFHPVAENFDFALQGQYWLIIGNQALNEMGTVLNGGTFTLGTSMSGHGDKIIAHPNGTDVLYVTDWQWAQITALNPASPTQVRGHTLYGSDLITTGFDACTVGSTGVAFVQYNRVSIVQGFDW